MILLQMKTHPWKCRCGRRVGDRSIKKKKNNNPPISCWIEAALLSHQESSVFVLANKFLGNLPDVFHSSLDAVWFSPSKEKRLKHEAEALYRAPSLEFFPFCQKWKFVGVYTCSPHSSAFQIIWNWFSFLETMLLFFWVWWMSRGCSSKSLLA